MAYICLICHKEVLPEDVQHDELCLIRHYECTCSLCGEVAANPEERIKHEELCYGTYKKNFKSRASVY